MVVSASVLSSLLSSSSPPVSSSDGGSDVSSIPTDHIEVSLSSNASRSLLQVEARCRRLGGGGRREEEGLGERRCLFCSAHVSISGRRAAIMNEIVLGMWMKLTSPLKRIYLIVVRVRVVVERRWKGGEISSWAAPPTAQQPHAL